MLKSARKIELLIIAAMLCVLVVLWMGDANTASVKESDDEQRMRRLLSRIEGAGGVNVMIAENDMGEKTGVVVAAEGAGNVRVMLEIQQAVQTLTGLELSRIEIVKSEN